MKWGLRRLGASETDWEKLFGLYTLTPLLLVCLAAHRWNMIPACLFRRTTGLPCPTCGSVRAWDWLASGHFIEAFMAQPLISLIEVATVAFLVYSWIVVVFKTRRIRISNMRVGILISSGLFLLALNWFYLLWRTLFPA